MGLNNFILTCEKDNEELRKDLEYYKNQNARLKKQNQELKSQLKGTTHCFDEEEHKRLKEQLENSIKVNMADHKYASECEDKVVVLEAHQKEFIKYLEDEIEQNTPNARWKHYNEDGFNDYDVENPSCIKVQPTHKVLNEILQKYEEIINGDDK